MDGINKVSLKKEILVLSIMLLAAVAVRIYISTIFYGQSSDEYCNISLISNTFVSGFKSYPNLFMWFYYFISALLLFIIPDGLIAAKVVSISFGISSMLIVYFLAKKIFNRRIAFLSLLLLLINPEFNLIGSVPLKEPVYTFFVILSLFLLVNRRIFAGAFIVGMSFLTRAEGLLIIMPAYLVSLLKTRKKSLFKISLILIIFILFVLFMNIWVPKPFCYIKNTLDIHEEEQIVSLKFQYISIMELIKRIFVTIVKTCWYVFDIIGPCIIFIVPGIYSALTIKDRDKVSKFFIYFIFYISFWLAYIFWYGQLIYNFHRYLYALIPFAAILISAGFFKLYEHRKWRYLIVTLFIVSVFSGYYTYYLDPGRQYIRISKDNKVLIEASRWIEKNIKQDWGHGLLIDGIPCFYMYRKSHKFRIVFWSQSHGMITPDDKESLGEFLDNCKIKYVIWQNDNLPAERLAPYLRKFENVFFENGGKLIPVKQFKAKVFMCNIYEYKTATPGKEVQNVR